MKDDPFAKEQSEPLFIALRDEDPELERCMREAQRTFSVFCNLHEKYRENLGIYFAIKVEVGDGEEIAHLWFAFRGVQDGLLIGEHFELPQQLAHLKRIAVESDQIEDWMINDHGVLYGGFSIRYQRSILPEGQRLSFDEYTGISKYAELG